MSSGRLILVGLVATRARLRFTGIIQNKLLWRFGGQRIISEPQVCLNCLCQPRGQAQTVLLRSRYGLSMTPEFRERSLLVGNRVRYARLHTKCIRCFCNNVRFLRRALPRVYSTSLQFPLTPLRLI